MSLALSTFWLTGRDWCLHDFFAAGVELGFACFELSGLAHDTFYDEIRPGDFCFGSLHDPAPPARGQVRIGSKELRRDDVVYTSLDEGRRQRAVAITKRSIDVASEYGAQAIVLHPGQTSAGPQIEFRLKEIFAEGKIFGTEANALREQLKTERAHQHREHMDALHRSLDELVAFASVRKIKLGLENRPTFEITNFLEMGEILDWYSDNTIGYWHDTGHAQVQANLGFVPQIEWLRAYGNRIIGMHLHDAVGTDYHLAPGIGNVDWNGLASLVPANVIRVLEVDKRVSADDVRTGVAHLRSTGWIGD